jgi:hypothetical protein
LFVEHVSPRVAQLDPVFTQAVPEQSLLQHAAPDVQPPPEVTQVWAVEQPCVVGLQYKEQHSLDSAHVAPAALHWFGPVQRLTPSMSWSQ